MESFGHKMFISSQQFLYQERESCILACEIFMWQFVKEVLVSIHTIFELSRCLVCPTIEINICSILLITDTFP